jgi:serine/threonine-protein kinase SRK2
MELLRKMKAQEYHLPDHVNLTQGCKALLRELLQPNPKRRVKMGGVLADPWFMTELPPDALTMNDRWLASKHACRQSEEETKRMIADATNV